jgi:hypothetical protein
VRTPNLHPGPEARNQDEVSAHHPTVVGLRGVRPDYDSPEGGENRGCLTPPHFNENTHNQLRTGFQQRHTFKVRP